MKTAVVIGVGPGIGGAYARRFSAGGYAVAMIARSARFASELAEKLSGASRSYACDVTDEAALRETLAKVERDLGTPTALLYNAGSGVWGDVEAANSDDFEKAWRVNAQGLFVASQALIPGMKGAGGGAIVVTGATASLRGGARFAAFASAKAAQRSLAQSMARHLMPQGIHVALLIIDGMVDLPSTRERMPDVPADKFLDPDAVAETAFFVAHQPRSAWSFEIEARPHVEPW